MTTLNDIKKKIEVAYKMNLELVRKKAILNNIKKSIKEFAKETQTNQFNTTNVNCFVGDSITKSIKPSKVLNYLMKEKLMGELFNELFKVKIKEMREILGDDMVDKLIEEERTSFNRITFGAKKRS